MYSPSSDTSEDPFLPYLTNTEMTSSGSNLSNETEVAAENPPNAKRKTKRGKGTMYTCDNCPFRTKYSADIRRHRIRHRDVKFPCEECNMPFMTKGHLNGHMEMIHGIKQPGDKRIWTKCKKCDYTTRHSGDLSRHMKRHDLAVVTCRTCGRPFLSASKMATHMEQAHGVNANFAEIKVSEFSRGKKRPRICRTSGKKKYSKHDSDSFDKNKCSEGADVHDANSNDNDKSDHESRARTSWNPQNKRIKLQPLGADKTTTRKETRPNEEVAILETEEIYYGQSPSTDKFEDVEDSEGPSENRDTPVEVLEQGMKCAFCGFVAFSFVELKTHLDVHDDQVLLRTASFHFPENSSVVGDEQEDNVTDEDNVAAVTAFSDNLMLTDIGNSKFPAFYEERINTGNRFPYPVRTENVVVNGKPQLFLSRERNLKPKFKVCSEIIPIRHPIISRRTRHPSNTKSTVNKETSIDRFLKFRQFAAKPFACSKCFFTTRNINHLRFHVHAHLCDFPRNLSNAESLAKEDLTTDLEDELLDVEPETAKNNRTVDETVGKRSFIKRHIAENKDALINTSANFIETAGNESVCQERSAEVAVDETIRNNDDGGGVDATEVVNQNTLNPVVNTQKKSKDCTKDEAGYSLSGEILQSKWDTRRCLVGRLSKEYFKKHRKFYVKDSENLFYECLICEKENQFESRPEIKEHFEDRHQLLRDKICKTCKYCSRPFP